MTETKAGERTMAKDDSSLSLRRDDGVAMILVIGWSMLMMGMALVVVQSVIRQIQPSARSEHSFAALAAAEAGVDDYRARLLGSATPYYLIDDTENPAFTGWTPVPGGDTDAEFTYVVDRTRVRSGGDLRVYVTGRSPRGEGGVMRTLEAGYSKRSTLDYVYLSDLETTAPDQPGAYSEAAASGGSFETAKELAGMLCTRYWWMPGPVKPATSAANVTNEIYPEGNQRNINFCQWPHISNSERMIGSVHTNDVWRLDDQDLTNTFLPNSLTSSCPDKPPATVGCPINNPPATVAHRYISGNFGNDSWNSPENWTTSSSSSSTAYQAESPLASESNGTYDTRRNPGFDARLALPVSADLLKKQASLDGCVYTGPTRIRFLSDGTMHVTSPNTKQTAPWCDGTATGTTLYDATPSHHTATVDLSRFTDLVIYVQNTPRAATDDADNAYDLNNVWAVGADPACAVKSGTTNQFPFVVPDDSLDVALFTSVTGRTWKGFPSEWAWSASPWYPFANCGNGDVYVQGQYKYSTTIASANNISITGDLTDWTSPLTPVPSSSQPLSTTLGKPNPSLSSAVLGLVSDRFVYLYRPYEANHSSFARDWTQTNAATPILNFALLAIDTCFGTQDPYYGTGRQGYIYMYGSIAHKYRCIVGSTGGYSKNYHYDDRLASHTPPYMLELSNDPWRNGRIGEVSPIAQAVGTTVNYPLVLSDEDDASVRTPELSTGSADEVDYNSTSHSLPVHATGPGLIVLSYVVTPAGGTVGDVRRLVIWAS